MFWFYKFKPMKQIILLLSILCVTNIILSQEKGFFTDPRDGKTYETVKIGNKWIMSDNFAFKPIKGMFWAYNSDSSNISKYGYLYDWQTAMKIAPKGWHLPSKEELDTLYYRLGNNDSIVFEKIIKIGLNNKFGGSCYRDGSSSGINEFAFFWSNTENGGNNSAYFIINLYSKRAYVKVDNPKIMIDNKFGGKSVRLFKGDFRSNEFLSNENLTDYYTDLRDGRKYKIVKVGTQTWMAENFAFRPTTGEIWAYKDDDDNILKYGYLYDWDAARTVAPEGWHLPTLEDWHTFYKYLGDNPISVYQAFTQGGNSGFDILLGGWRDVNGEFHDKSAVFWSDTEDSESNKMKEILRSNVWVILCHKEEGMAGVYSLHPTCGFSVRLIKNN
jgi:uncharacterized protein (TIGR02145 family)